MEIKMQRAIIVDGFETLTTLNKWLENGAKVIHTCPMPSSASVATQANGTTSRLHCRRSALVVTEGEQGCYRGIELPYNQREGE